MERKGKIRIILIFSILFLAVAILLALIFFSGKKTYVVRFELNGGTLVSGSLEQHVVQGQDAIPPTVVKEGAVFQDWSAPHKQITNDVVITALWEYTTTPGIRYTDTENQNFAEIAEAYKYIKGEVYIGSYYNKKKILGIQDYAFFECAQITKISLPTTLLSIGAEAFSGCTSLTEIEIPKNVTYLGSGSFRGCEALERIVLPEGLLEIDAAAFAGCTALKSIVIPKTVTSIGAGAFYGCEALESVTLNVGLLEIDNAAFEGCTSLTSIRLPQTVTYLGAKAFRGCEKLESATLNVGLLEIGANAFESCSALTAITIPKTVEKIGTNAFSDCESLEITVQIPKINAPEGWESDWSGNASVKWTLGLVIEPLRPRPIFPPKRELK